VVVVGLEGVAMVVVEGVGQFFLHPVGFPKRRFTLSIDTDGVGILLLIDDGDGTAPRILLVSSCLMSSTSMAAVDGSSENSIMLVRRFIVVFLFVQECDRFVLRNVDLYYRSGEG